MTKKQQTKARLAVIIGTMFSLMIISSLFGLAWPLMQVQAGPTLPPREQPASAPDNDDGKEDRSNTPALAHIKLSTQSAPAGDWSVVQWQDPTGGWHDVEGWRSELSSGDYQRWAVEAKDFSDGPFRWQVTQGLGGAVLGTSESFNLPAGANEIVPVKVVLQ